jgi:hypothetical protein
LSKSATSESRVGFVAFAWRIALAFWVGGALSLQLVSLPGLQFAGLAPMLADDVRLVLTRMQIETTLWCAAFQWLLLMIASPQARRLRDARLLALAFAAVACLFDLFVQDTLPMYDFRITGMLLVASGLWLLSRPAPEYRKG